MASKPECSVFSKQSATVGAFVKYIFCVVFLTVLFFPACDLQERHGTVRNNRVHHLIPSERNCKQCEYVSLYP